MPRIDRSTLTYIAVCTLIALAAAALWVLATGRLHIPGPVIAVLGTGAAFLTAGIERGVQRRHVRRRRPAGARRRTHARSKTTTRKAT
ncbi:hypothetical protein ACWC4D_40875 [Streptomyces sp. NPDC001288]